ncbi:MAG: radical SAM protein [Promethearchaeota archaeon]
MKGHKLTSVVWEITLDCNLECIHCGSSAGAPRVEELTTEEGIKLIYDLTELDVKNICLMGGEPFLRKDWFKLANEVNELGVDVSFVSNGILVEKMIEKLASLDPLVVGISLDGMKEVHNRIRGNHSWKHAIKALDLLASREIEATVITTVSKINLKELPKIKQLLLGRDIGWQIQYALPMGRFWKKYVLSPEEYYALGIFMNSCRMKYTFDDLPVIGGHGSGYYSRFLHSLGYWQGCTAGIASLGIRSNGDITGCLTLPKEFDEENIRRKHIREIWEDENAFAYTRKFKQGQLGNNCRVCEFGRICKGGCSAPSIYFTGRFHNNPYCFRGIEKRNKIRFDSVSH